MLRNRSVQPCLVLWCGVNFEQSSDKKTEDTNIAADVFGDVERNGVEPMTSTMPLLRSTN